MKKKLLIGLLIIAISCLNFGFADVVGTTNQEISKIIIKYNSLSKNVGDRFALPYSVQPQTASKKDVLWFSSNPTVATVNSSGEINCKSVGQTTLQAVSNNSIALATCQLSVISKSSQTKPPKKQTPVVEQPENKTIALDSVALNHTQLELVKGDSQYLIAAYYPADATNKAAEWISKTPSVVSIDQNGLITAKKVGKSTIYIVAKDGAKKSYCIVYVLPAIKEEKRTNIAPVELPFEDVTKDNLQYDYADIEYVYNEQLMNGISETMFDPNAAVTRAMLATVVYRLAGEQEVFINLKFKDVLPSDWYAKAVQWAGDVSLINGIAEGVFAPDDQLTREQLVTILYRYAQYRKADTNSFEDILYLADREEISNWALPAVKWAHKNHLLSIKKGFIRPKAPATRADIARALHAVVKNVFEN